VEWIKLVGPHVTPPLLVRSLNVVAPPGQPAVGGRDRFLISTGEGPGKVFFNDVWQFNLATETWSEIITTGPKPEKRYGASGLL